MNPPFDIPAVDTKPVSNMYSDKVPAGFPSPAADYAERPLDLNDYCIKKPAATFFVRAQGDSMRGVGIYDNDLLVVDRSLSAAHRRIVIAVVDGEFTVKRLDLSDPDRPVLRAENPEYQDIHLKDGNELQIFGVVRNVIHSTLDV
ncbi:LexA family protein [Marinobacter salsuginis]|uniref:Protein impA n=1 Tax=Marinobacter salsuginis TaxID=418719 RepID=A0A5M3Q0M8_9GAMM|nr:protein impA' [Marinobacter salsuginis]